MWTAMGAYAIPSMEFFGITADLGSTVFSVSSFVTVRKQGFIFYF